MDRPSSGIGALDELVGGLGVGDNVVWQAPEPADDRPRGHRGATATVTEAARRIHTAGVRRLRSSTMRAGWSGSSAAPTC
jgi:hypothetical protein